MYFFFFADMIMQEVEESGSSQQACRGLKILSGNNEVSEEGCNAGVTRIVLDLKSDEQLTLSSDFENKTA